jgi:hypothetical protein
MTNQSLCGVRGVLYVYHCALCGHKSDVRLNGDSHDGDIMDCAKCYEPVTLEWDGGVTFHGVEHICKLYNY